jgi:hypothetical protein
MTDKAGNFVRFAAPGQSDLYGMLPASHHSTHVEIEVKRPGNKPTPTQLKWLKGMTDMGAIAFWCDSPTVAEDIMRAILAGGEVVWHEDENFDIEM